MKINVSEIQNETGDFPKKRYNFRNRVNPKILKTTAVYKFSTI